MPIAWCNWRSDLGERTPKSLLTTWRSSLHMAKILFSRYDIESLSRRLEDRSWSRLMSDMPELQRDIRSASKLLKFMIETGLPVNPIEIE